MAETAPQPDQEPSEFGQRLREAADVVVETDFPSGALSAPEVLATREWHDERRRAASEGEDGEN